MAKKAKKSQTKRKTLPLTTGPMLYADGARIPGEVMLAVGSHRPEVVNVTISRLRKGASLPPDQQIGVLMALRDALQMIVERDDKLRDYEERDLDIEDIEDEIDTAECALRDARSALADLRVRG